MCMEKQPPWSTNDWLDPDVEPHPACGDLTLGATPGAPSREDDVDRIGSIGGVSRTGAMRNDRRVEVA